MKAVGNNIIIIPEKVKTDKTKGGLLIIEKDDVIFYDRHAGHGIEFEKEKFIVIKLQDVVVVL